MSVFSLQLDECLLNWIMGACCSVFCFLAIGIPEVMFVLTFNDYICLHLVPQLSLNTTRSTIMDGHSYRCILKSKNGQEVPPSKQDKVAFKNRWSLGTRGLYDRVNCVFYLTELNNMCIDLIRYRSSSYIQHLHTCIRESEKCGNTKRKHRKIKDRTKETN